MSSRARKRARAAAAGEVRVSRSELKNAEARAQLEPLAEGERPTAVTVAAVVTTLLTVANLVAAVTGLGPQGDNIAPGIVYTLLLGSMSYGLWKARYWAVLGLQALLAISMIATAFALLVAGNVLTALVAVVTIAGCGTLFWFLVKAMARIQMPDRR